MVRQLKSRIVSDWKAMLVVFIAGGAVVWHILACQESPMAFSPDGNRLALVTMEPYGDEKDIMLQGPRAYRLMIVDREKRLDVVETSTDHMLSAPAFSPDGQRICYLRIPLLTKSAQQRLEATRKQLEDANRVREEALKPIHDFKWPASGAASKPDSTPNSPEDQTLPPAVAAVELARAADTSPLAPVRVVLRDAATRKIIREITAHLPLPAEDQAYFLNYLLIRPQFSPDGQWLYFSFSNTALAVNLQTGVPRIVATAAQALSLSPDGKQLAILSGSDDDGLLGFIQTDGTAARHYRWKKRASPSGLTWLNADTVAILEPKPGKEQYVHLVRPDGSTRKVIPLKMNLTDDSKGLGVGELAMSPDGKHIVVALPKDVYFLKAGGETEKHLHDEKVILAQPTFAPDSNRIAMKLISDDASGSSGCRQIVFFTPKGKQTAAVKVPPLPAGTIHPAGE